MKDRGDVVRGVAIATIFILMIVYLFVSFYNMPNFGPPWGNVDPIIDPDVVPLEEPDLIVEDIVEVHASCYNNICDAWVGANVRNRGNVVSEESYTFLAFDPVDGDFGQSKDYIYTPPLQPGQMIGVLGEFDGLVSAERVVRAEADVYDEVEEISEYNNDFIDTIDLTY